ncbi:MAG: hypothetical protein RH862_04955 [Leptospiraceae bacterium]
MISLFLQAPGPIELIIILAILLMVVGIPVGLITLVIVLIRQSKQERKRSTRDQ